MDDRADWQPIEDAPKDRFILMAITCGDGVYRVVPGNWCEMCERWHELTTYETADGRMNIDLDGPWQPTHWMPLPELPLGSLAGLAGMH